MEEAINEQEGSFPLESTLEMLDPIATWVVPINCSCWTNKELSGLCMVVPREMDSILFGRPPL